jgi:hypothetical protein
MSTDTQSPSRISGLQPSIDPVREELRCYDEHLRDMHGLLPGTRRAYLRIAGRLLRQRFGHETPATTQLPEGAVIMAMPCARWPPLIGGQRVPRLQLGIITPYA